MKKLLALLVCLAGLVLSAPSAKAAVYDYNVVQSSQGGNAGADNANGFHVTLTSNDNVNFSVIAKALGAPRTPPQDVFQLQFTFTMDGFNGNQFVDTVSGVGGTNGSTTPFVAGNNYSFNAATGMFTTSNPSIYLKADGSNTFTGMFSLANSQARFLVTQFAGRTTQYTANLALAPEMPGAALLLPALLPVGMVLRGKKRGFRNLLRSNATV